MKKVGFTFVMAISMLSLQTTASNWSEADSLARLVAHLEAGKKLLAQAKSARDTDKRLQFDFEQFESDIFKLQQGIKVYLNKPQEPRKFKELNSSFTSYKRKGS